MGSNATGFVHATTQRVTRRLLCGETLADHPQRLWSWSVLHGKVLLSAVRRPLAPTTYIVPCKCTVSACKLILTWSKFCSNLRLYVYFASGLDKTERPVLHYVPGAPYAMQIVLCVCEFFIFRFLRGCQVLSQVKSGRIESPSFSKSPTFLPGCQVFPGVCWRKAGRCEPGHRITPRVSQGPS